MSNNIVSVSNWIKGDISNCWIEQGITKVDRSSIFSLSSKTTYQVYNKCTMQIQSEYTVPEITWRGVIIYTIFFCLAAFLTMLVITIVFGRN